MKDTGRNTIFISHRTVDAAVADMIKDFLVNTGIPNDKEKQESRINNIEDVASGRYFYDFSLRDVLPQQAIDKLIENVEGIDVDDNGEQIKQDSARIKEIMDAISGNS